MKKILCAFCFSVLFCHSAWAGVKIVLNLTQVENLFSMESLKSGCHGFHRSKFASLAAFGAFFATVTGSVGAIMQDVTRKGRRMETLKDNLGPETPALTGLFF